MSRKSAGVAGLESALPTPNSSLKAAVCKAAEAGAIPARDSNSRSSLLTETLSGRKRIGAKCRHCSITTRLDQTKYETPIAVFPHAKCAKAAKKTEISR